MIPKNVCSQNGAPDGVRNGFLSVPRRALAGVGTGRVVVTDVPMGVRFGGDVRPGRVFRGEEEGNVSGLAHVECAEGVAHVSADVVFALGDRVDTIENSCCRGRKGVVRDRVALVRVLAAGKGGDAERGRWVDRGVGELADKTRTLAVGAGPLGQARDILDAEGKKLLDERGIETEIGGVVFRFGVYRMAAVGAEKHYNPLGKGECVEDVEERRRTGDVEINADAELNDQACVGPVRTEKNVAHDDSPIDRGNHRPRIAQDGPGMNPKFILENFLQSVTEICARGHGGISVKII